MEILVGWAFAAVNCAHLCRQEVSSKACLGAHKFLPCGGATRVLSGRWSPPAKYLFFGAFDIANPACHAPKLERKKKTELWLGTRRWTPPPPHTHHKVFFSNQDSLCHPTRYFLEIATHVVSPPAEPGWSTNGSDLKGVTIPDLHVHTLLRYLLTPV
jgi:hypothetical protein